MNSKINTLSCTFEDSKLEDHYDNLAACFNGGIQLCIPSKSDVIISNIEYDTNIKLQRLKILKRYKRY